jgi:ABC-2 type transport system permease protein
MDTKLNAVSQPSTTKNNTLSLPVNIFLLVVRSLTTLMRTPEALLPPVAISIFFLVIYQSTLGKAADFIPGIGGSYLGFILPLSIVSGSLSGSGIAAQNLVRDIERGYFDKLLLTPVRRAALLLAPILAGAVILGIQAAIVVAVGLLLGLSLPPGYWACWWSLVWGCCLG